MDFTRIPVASYVFFGLFILVSIVHLVFCYIENERLRKMTKCFTTLFLVIAVIIAIPEHPLVYVGAFMGLLGDFFLLKKHKVFPFVAGMLSFLVNHILYIAMFMVLSQPLHYGFYVATALYCVLFPLLFYHFGRKIIHQRHIAFGGTAYIGFLVLDLIWAIIACAMGNVDYCLLAAFGAFCFIISDAFLAFTLFKKNIKRRDFFIMSTYLLAQGLICVGFVLTLLK